MLGEGRSVVQVSILDLNQSVVATYSYNWLVDTTPLSVNALTGNAAYGSTAGSVWKMGLEATGQFDFTSTNVTDVNGIEKGMFYVYRSNGSLFSTT